MNGGRTAPKLKERRRVGFGGIPLDTPPLAAGRFIDLIGNPQLSGQPVFAETLRAPEPNLKIFSQSPSVLAATKDTPIRFFLNSSASQCISPDKISSRNPNKDR
jgi:hypothetical protein